MSHDLKTPLSSIYGYSMMLESKQYDWSPEEVKEMGQVVREKSEYMSKLIEDLNLTYRLKNDALPIERKLTSLIPFLKMSLRILRKIRFLKGMISRLYPKKSILNLHLMKRGSGAY